MKICPDFLINDGVVVWRLVYCDSLWIALTGFGVSLNYVRLLFTIAWYAVYFR